MIHSGFLVRWIASALVGILFTGSFMIIFSPCFILIMLGYPPIFWILYHFGIVFLFFITSVSQTITLRHTARLDVLWIASTTSGWLTSAILSLSLSSNFHSDALWFHPHAFNVLWIAGGLFSGVLQWATVFQSRRGLIWIVASLLGALAILAVKQILSSLFFLMLRTPLLLALFPAESEIQSLLILLAIILIESFAIMLFATITGVAYWLLFRPQNA